MHKQIVPGTGISFGMTTLNYHTSYSNILGFTVLFYTKRHANLMTKTRTMFKQYR